MRAALSIGVMAVCAAVFTPLTRGSSDQRATDGARTTTPRVLEAIANDNRTPAAALANKVLTIRLEAVPTIWRPEKQAGPSREVYAFAQEGHTPEIPGPLLRVPEGTELHVVVSNRIPGVNLKIHGLLTRPSDNDATIDLAPGGVHETRFKAGAPGTYFYWGTAGAPFNQRNGPDVALTGAFIVDGSKDEPSDDRIFVLTEWLGPVVPEGELRKVSLAINGLSWPHTDRLLLDFGKPATWRVINGTLGAHPMHLHGTFYTVESRGTAVRDVIYGSEARRLVTTEQLDSGATMMMRWVPDRVGNWLFHCHILAHVSGSMRLADLTPSERGDADKHAEHDPMTAMAGLVLGITVKPGDETAAPDLETHGRQRMTLFLRTTPARYGANPAYGFALENGDATEPAGKASTLSPPIVVTKDQPVAIMVKNRLPEETSIHWHGIELESFHDGVPGWSGQSPSLMPPVRPGETFEVHFTPPRAGTFIYHTHGHDSRQLISGLYGALIVLEPGRKFDPAAERIVLLGGAGPGSQAIEINRSTNPLPIEIKVGVKNRFRFINITTNFTARVTLRADTGPLQWRAIAKDGADLPPDQASVRPARFTIGVGETYDFEYEATTPGELILEVARVGANGTVTSVAVRATR